MGESLVNATQFSRVMRHLANAPSGVNRLIAKDIKAEIERNFSAGLDYDRRPFKALSKSYERRRKYPGKPILTQEETLRNSIRVTAYNGIRITVGTPYALAHNFGYPPNNLPRRQFIPTTRLPTAWKEIILFRYEEATEKAINGR
jgi:phage gpG-like protein